MKKQFEAVWFTTNGNRHTLYPIYANAEEEAKNQVLDFIEYSKKTNFTFLDSIKISLS